MKRFNQSKLGVQLMQSALGRANIVIECHRAKLVTVIWATGSFVRLLQ